MSVDRSGVAKYLLVFGSGEPGRHGLACRRKAGPVIRVADPAGVKSRAAVGRLDEMDRDKLGIDAGKERGNIAEQLSGDVLRAGRCFTEIRIVFVQELMIEPIVNNPAGPPFDLTDVDQHSGNRVDPATENEKNDVVASGAVSGASFLAKCGDVLGLAPARHK